MYCKKCGKQINNNAAFCPFCGCKMDNKQSNSNALYPIHQIATKKKLLTMMALAIAVILLIAFPLRYTVEKAIVKSIAADKMQMIKDGPSAETMDEIVVEILHEFTGSDLATEFLHNQITGEDIKDVYASLMTHMTYKIKKVDRVDSKHYRITVYVENIDNKKVASRAWGLFSERYDGLDILEKLAQAKADWTSDKSSTISDYISDAADQLYHSDKMANTLSGEYVISATKEDDEWKISFEGGAESFILNCAGISY